MTRERIYSDEDLYYDRFAFEGTEEETYDHKRALSLAESALDTLDNALTDIRLALEYDGSEWLRDADMLVADAMNHLESFLGGESYKTK